MTRELLKDNERVGFELVSSLGQTATLASVESESPIRVSRYGVELPELESFLNSLPQPDSNHLLYLDEIGQMELYSDKFKTLVAKYLNTEGSFIGTLTSVYIDDFVESIKKRPDIQILEVTQENRDQLAREILELFRK